MSKYHSHLHLPNECYFLCHLTEDYIKKKKLLLVIHAYDNVGHKIIGNKCFFYAIYICISFEKPTVGFTPLIVFTNKGIASGL